MLTLIRKHSLVEEVSDQLAGAIRSGNYDTGVIAVIGLVINGGVLGFLAWYMFVIRPTLPL